MRRSGPIGSSDARYLQRIGISATAPSDGQVLQYVNATGLYTPTSPSALGSAVASSNTTSAAVSSAADGQTLSLPAGALAADQDHLEIVTWGELSGGSGGPSLNVRLAFGSTNVLDHNYPNTVGVFVIRATIARVGATSQVAIGTIWLHQGADSHSSTQRTAPAETLSGAITIKNAVASYTDGTVTFYGLAYRVHRKSP